MIILCFVQLTSNEVGSSSDVVYPISNVNLFQLLQLHLLHRIRKRTYHSHKRGFENELFQCTSMFTWVSVFLFGSDNARSQQHRATFKRLTKVAFLGNGVLHLFLLFPFLVPYSPFYCRRKTKENPTRINHPFLLLQFWNRYLLKITIHLKDHAHCFHQMVGKQNVFEILLFGIFSKTRI